MTTADNLRERTEHAINGRYWTIDAYIDKIETEMKKEADKRLFYLCWIPYHSCPDAIPDKERMEKIVKRLRKKGFKADIGNYYENNSIYIYWDKKTEFLHYNLMSI